MAVETDIYQLALDQHASVVITDAEGNITEANDHFCQAAKRTRQELIGANIRVLNSGRHEPQFFEELWAAIRVGRVWRGDICNRAADGSLFWVDATVMAIGPDRFLSIQNVITERKEAENAYRRAAAQLQFLHELGEAARALDDPEEIMKAMAQMLGKHLKASRCAYADVAEDNDTFTIKHDYTDGCASTTGTYRLALFGPRAEADMRRGTPLVIRNVDGELSSDEGAEMFKAIGIKAIICCAYVNKEGLRAMMAVHQEQPRDWTADEIELVTEVTERCWSTIVWARARQAEQRTRRKFEELFEQAPDATLMVDSTGRITLVNRGAETLFGVDRAQLLGQPIGRWLLNADAEMEMSLERRICASSEPGFLGEDGMSVRGRRRDGSEFPAELSLSPLRGDDAELTAVAVRDVSERLELDRKERHSQRLESVGTLASGVAHDLNNALTPVLMACEMIREKYPKEADLIDTIENSTRHGANMVAQLLTFARGSEGKRVSMRVVDLVKSIGTMITRTFPKNIEFSLKYASDLPPVIGDATQLHQVLLNLCVNARDAMPGGGRLRITVSTEATGKAPVAADATDGQEAWLCVRVEDSGEGIPAEVQERIFEPFFTTKGPEYGTGLGLATAMGIVKSHGGMLEVDSRPGDGTIFSVYLPTAPEAGAAEDAAGPVGEFVGQGQVVLVVDDEPAILRMAEIVLRRLGLEPVLATGGEEALSAARENSGIQAVVTDCNMPGMNGVEFAHLFTSEFPGVPMAVASGRLDPDTESSFAELGVVHLLHKPYTHTQLTETLNALLPTR